MKRTRKQREAPPPLPFFALNPNGAHIALTLYAQNTAVRSAAYDETDGKYTYTARGSTVRCGGLIRSLKRQFYPAYDDRKKKRHSKKIKVRGSTPAQGKTVDRQLLEYVVAGAKRLPQRCTKMTRALLAYWDALGHKHQASQLPVPLLSTMRMTQADYITQDPLGQLWVWEVKTGFPVGGFRAQKQQQHFSNIDGAQVKATKYNMWQLQLHYTVQGLRASGLPVHAGRVIQVYMEKGDDKPRIKVHEPPKWTAYLPEM